MLDLGWSELLTVAVVVLLVFGPRELPHLLASWRRMRRTLSRAVETFRGGLNDLADNSDIAEIRSSLPDVSVSGLANTAENWATETLESPQASPSSYPSASISPDHPERQTSSDEPSNDLPHHPGDDAHSTHGTEPFEAHNPKGSGHNTSSPGPTAKIEPQN